ncbi:MAG: metallophosphoesterase [Bdellovibrionales bacterium]|nr:metallophosphoesterase [Bdellovibrionales bacterium]
MKLCLLLIILGLSSNAFSEYKKASEIEQFVILGDTGKENEDQRVIANSMTMVCGAIEQCDAALLLGDNVYGEGMTWGEDPFMDRVFRNFYENLDFPFYAVLGNHDYGKFGRQWEKGAFEIEYSKTNPQFILPSHFYVKEFKHMVVAFIDTSRLMWGKDIKNQGQMVNAARELALKSNKWFVVAGHHPYLSNGQHGNAGNYDRIPFPYFISGRFVKRFFDKYINGKADLYFSGHDHTIQFLDGKQRDTSTYFILSGAGASVEKLSNRNPVDYQSAELGYLHLKTSLKKLEIKVYSKKSEVSFTKAFER